MTQLNPKLKALILEKAGYDYQETKSYPYHGCWYRNKRDRVYYKDTDLDWNILHDAFSGLNPILQTDFGDHLIGQPSVYVTVILNATKPQWLTAFARTFGVEETI